MKKSITNGIIVLAALFFGYHVVDAMQASHRAQHFGEGLSQQLEAIDSNPD